MSRYSPTVSDRHCSMAVFNSDLKFTLYNRSDPVLGMVLVEFRIADFTQYCPLRRYMYTLKTSYLAELMLFICLNS